MKKRLTEVAQQRVAAVLSSGEFAIDATAGNGHDTVFLAACVEPGGRVFAFDIQSAAILATQNRLAEFDLCNVDLLQVSHAELESVLPESAIGSVGAVMFNLGYLPGGDHAVMTEPVSTLSAIDAALRVLRLGGVLTIVAYPGHSGGDAEASAVERHLQQLDQTAFSVERIDGESGRNAAPVLFLTTKGDSESSLTS